MVDFLAGNPLPDPLSLSELAKENLSAKKWDMAQRPDLWVQQTCELCEVVTTNKPEWEAHIKNSRHKKRVAKAKKRVEVQAFLAERRRKEEERNEREGEAKGKEDELKEQEKELPDDKGAIVLDTDGQQERLEETEAVEPVEAAERGTKRKDIRRSAAQEKDSQEDTTGAA